MDRPQLKNREARQSSTAAEAAVATIGAALVVCAFAANQRWLDRHFLPSFFLPRAWYVGIETGVRMAIGAAGVTLALVVRPRIGRFVARGAGGAVAVAIAAVLALTASELALRFVHPRPANWLAADEEPRRRADPRLGWTLMPARTGRASIGGRVVEYAVDGAGYRVRRVDEPVDSGRPAIIFIGESVMFGEGLSWDESVPAQVGAMMHTASANLAVHGYSNDQAYLRLEAELPRFRQPVAVVALFMTALFGRNLDDDRPHLGPGLTWLPAQEHGRLISLASLLVPFRRDDTVDRGIATTRDVLGATCALARRRGATPLIVVPQFGPEDDAGRALRRRVFEGTNLPDLVVEIDAGWRLAWDRHPNAEAARAIAAAIAARLSQP